MYFDTRKITRKELFSGHRFFKILDEESSEPSMTVIKISYQHFSRPISNKVG